MFFSCSVQRNKKPDFLLVKNYTPSSDFDYNKHKVSLYLSIEEPGNYFIHPLLIVNDYIFNDGASNTDFDHFFETMCFFTDEKWIQVISKSRYCLDSCFLVALLPKEFWGDITIAGPREYYEIVNYQGIVNKDMDTIRNWHMVPPFIEFKGYSKELNLNRSKYYLISKTYVRYNLSQKEKVQILNLLHYYGLFDFKNSF